MEITTIGLDLAKSVFQLHAVDGAVVWRKKVRRGALLETLAKVPACLVGMEACATAHYWAREISALGHEVRLMPPAYVKAYLRRQKNDAADAEAICEAVRRPTMRFVPAKGAERQAVLVLHRSRELLVRQRTMLINAIRGHCAEFRLIAAQGVCGSRDLIERVRQADSAVLPDIAKAAMMLLAEQLHALVRQIQALNQRLLIWHRQDLASQRLATIPGVGVISATALAASVTDPGAFRSSRGFSASLGLVPRQNSSGGKDNLGRISRVIATSGSCSWSARHRWCDGREPRIPLRPAGFAACSSASRPGLSPLPWPTRPPGSSGRCWRAARPIARLPQSENNRGAHARPRRTVRVPH